MTISPPITSLARKNTRSSSANRLEATQAQTAKTQEVEQTAGVAEVTDSALRKPDGALRDVRKPVEMAVIEPKTRKINLWSRKAWLFLVSYSLTHDGTLTQDGTVWRVPLTTLMKDAKFGSKDRRHLKESIKECQKTLVEWSGSARDSLTGETRLWSSTQLLGSVEFIEDERGRACLEWSLPPVLLRQLREYKHFYMVSLEVVADIKLNCTLALYEIICRYKTNPKGLTMRRPWRDWIPLLTGESDENAEQRIDMKAGRGASKVRQRYGEYRYFRRDVVQRAVSELNEVQSEFTVEPVPVMRGRSVEELQFKIVLREQERNTPTVLKAEERPAQDPQVLEKAIMAGASHQFAAKLYDEYGAQQLASTAETALSTPGVRNPAGFMVAKLKQAAQEATQAAETPSVRAKRPSVKAASTRSSAPGETTQAAATAASTTKASVPVLSPSPSANTLQTAPSLRESLDFALTRYRNRLQVQAKSSWPTLSSELRGSYLSRFEREVVERTLYIRKDFLASGLKKPFVAAKFYLWLAEVQAEERGDGWTPSAEVLLAHLVGQVRAGESA
jgi:hypothetical protein